MKPNLLAPTLAFAASVTLARAAIIAQWNFNSLLPDNNTSTGTLTPVFGSGTAAAVGGITATFSTGSTNDPAPSDNSGWNTSSYPGQGTNNKTAGVQFMVSTLGYSDIVVHWEQRVTSTASKYCRFQYASDGLNFVDFPLPITATMVSAFEPQSVSLTGYGDVDDNPNFLFRIASEFESTALGGGAEEYVTTFGTNNYSRAGTIRFDMVTVEGTPIPGANTPPHISGFPDRTVRVGQTTGPLPFSVWDAEDPPENLTVGANSSDQAVIPEETFSLAGSGTNRTLTFSAGSEPGLATITVWVSDPQGRLTSASFAVTVLPANTVPVISDIPGTNTLLNTPTGPLAFSIGDLETPTAGLALSATSANPVLVPNDAAHIRFGGSGSNRTVTLTPAAGQSGVAPMRITVSDGTNTASTSFALMVRPTAEVVFYDPFDYADGSVLTNSAFLWGHRSGTNGQCEIIQGQLQVTANQSEDVVAHLPGGPYARSNGLALYASFKINFQSLPKESPSYFAHFADGGTLRGRVYAATGDAWEGAFHLYVANGSDTAPTEFSAVLTTNRSYTVVTRYDIDTAATTLWVNPADESALHAVGADSQTPVPIASYGFRQDSTFGATVLIDDLKVGLSFAAVTAAPELAPIPLSIEPNTGGFMLRWTNPAFALQAAPAVGGPFTNVPGATSPFRVNGADPAGFFRLKGP